MEREEDRTKKAFAEAYRKLQSPNPSKRVTVKDIAAAAGYDRHTFYYHFTGVRDLISWIFDSEISRIIGNEGHWDSVIPQMVGYTALNRSFVLSLNHSSESDEIAELFKEKMRKMMRMYLDADAQYSSMSNGKKDLVSIFISGGAVAVFGAWLKSGMEKSSTDISAELIEMVSRSLESFQRM